jgi:hypothetical protein
MRRGFAHEHRAVAVVHSDAEGMVGESPGNLAGERRWHEDFVLLQGQHDLVGMDDLTHGALQVCLGGMSVDGSVNSFSLSHLSPAEDSA